MEEKKTFPRRYNEDEWCNAEKAIYDAIQVIEKIDAHPLLTNAIMAMDAAMKSVGDYIQTVGIGNKQLMDAAPDLLAVVVKLKELESLIAYPALVEEQFKGEAEALNGLIKMADNAILKALGD